MASRDESKLLLSRYAFLITCACLAYRSSFLHSNKHKPFRIPHLSDAHSSNYDDTRRQSERLRLRDARLLLTLGNADGRSPVYGMASSESEPLLKSLARDTDAGATGFTRLPETLGGASMAVQINANLVSFSVKDLNDIGVSVPWHARVTVPARALRPLAT